jgi:hypothetical protein
VARWIDNYEVKGRDPECVGHAVIAGWWPTTYYTVLTLEENLASARDGILALTRHIYELDAGKEEFVRDSYVTVVMKCDRYGMSPPQSDPIAEVEYADRSKAADGHQRIVQAVAEGGKRGLFRLLSTWEALTHTR